MLRYKTRRLLVIIVLRSLGAAFSVEPVHLSVRPSCASDFLEIGKL